MLRKPRGIRHKRVCPGWNVKVVLQLGLGWSQVTRTCTQCALEKRRTRYRLAWTPDKWGRLPSVQTPFHGKVAELWQKFGGPDGVSHVDMNHIAEAAAMSAEIWCPASDREH